MFSLLTLIAPGLKRIQIPQLLKYARHLLVAAVVLAAGFICYKVYNSLAQEHRLVQANAKLVIEQRDVINKQAQDISDLKNQVGKLQASHAVTLESLEELRQQKAAIRTVTVTRKKNVDTALVAIAQQSTTEEDKDLQRSDVLISDLNGTYCEFFPMNCKEAE